MTSISRRNLQEQQPLEDDGCTCQGCGERYRVDLLVPDALWDEVRPAGKEGHAGMLCGPCIMKAIEGRGEFDAFLLVKPD